MLLVFFVFFKLFRYCCCYCQSSTHHWSNTWRNQRLHEPAITSLLNPTAQGQVFSVRSIRMENYGSDHLYDEMHDTQRGREASQV